MDYLLRPISTKDLDDLYEIACLAEKGLTSLPKNKEILEYRIIKSLNSFNLNCSQPGGELYIFALEDLKNKKLIGSSAIISKVGGFEPFYAYKKSIKTHNSKKYNIQKNYLILNLIKEHNGPSEIASLYIHPDYRNKGIGKLLSLSRFLYIALHPERFESYIIAEMRGFVNSKGLSPFWDALGSCFFDMDYSDADYLSISDKSFIADLMPDIPIYIDLLPESAQNAIGKVHPNTQAALEILKKQGFTDTGLLDIFDAGPIYGSSVNNIKSVKSKKNLTLKGKIKENSDLVNVLVITNKIEFKAAYSLADIDLNSVFLPQETIFHLELQINDRVCILVI